MKTQIVLKNDHVTAPEKVFTECPCKECKSQDLFAFDGDVFCNDCGWNSIESRVSSQIDDHVTRWKQKKETALLALPYTFGAMAV